jgi:hypothetical protein
MKVRNTYIAIIKKGEQGYYFCRMEQVPEPMKITIGQKVTRRKIVC